MARTPLLRAVRELAGDHERAHAAGIDVEAVRERKAREREEVRRGMRLHLPPLTRRQLLVGGSAAVAGLLAPRLRGIAAASAQPRIAVIGGGLAGLTTALTLHDAGYTCTIYEALEYLGGRTRSDGQGFDPTDTSVSPPTCGRCHDVNKTVTPIWEEGQITDTFGELIDSNHATMLALADRFDLPLVDLLGEEPPGATETYFFAGRYFTKQMADEAYAALYPVLQDDLHAAGYPTTWDHSKPGGRALDDTSIAGWIDSRVPGGRDSAFGQLLDVAYNIEFGAETQDQSALNLLYLLGYSPSRTELVMYGESDERYHVAAGIETMPRTIAAYLTQSPNPVTVRTGTKLLRLARRSDGAYDLRFGLGFPDFRTTEDVVADIVVLTLPFTALRTLDIANAGFDARKLFAIDTLGGGHNAKVNLQFTRRLWNEPGPWGISGGTSYADTGYQVTWDATRGQPGQHGILVIYTGGDVTDAQYQRHPYANTIDRNIGIGQDAKRFLDMLEPVFPGLTPLWNGRASGGLPHLNPLWNCSYSYWKVGQYQTIAGYEQVPQGNVFFAGEHTSVDFQGWMEGAAASGVRAGNEVIAAARHL